MQDVKISLGHDLDRYELAMIAVVAGRTVHAQIDSGDSRPPNEFSISPEEAAKLLTSKEAVAEFSRLLDKYQSLAEELLPVREKICKMEAIFSGTLRARKKR